MFVIAILQILPIVFVHENAWWTLSWLPPTTILKVLISMRQVYIIIHGIGKIGCVTMIQRFYYCRTTSRARSLVKGYPAKNYLKSFYPMIGTPSQYAALFPHICARLNPNGCCRVPRRKKTFFWLQFQSGPPRTLFMVFLDTLLNVALRI